MMESLKNKIEQAQSSSIDDLVAKTQKKANGLRAANLVIMLVGAFFSILCDGDVRALGIGLCLAGVVLLCLVQLNTNTAMAAMWIVAEIRKGKKE